MTPGWLTRLPLSVATVVGVGLLVVAVACGPSPRADEQLGAATPADTALAGLLERADSLYFSSEYDSASAAYAAARDHAAELGDSSTVANALTWLGLAAWRQGRYAEARTFGEDALARKLRLDMRAELFRSYNALGLLANSEGRYTDAIELFARAAEAAEAVGDSVSLAKALGNRGMSYFELGEFERAQYGYETLRTLARATGDGRSEANALSNMASAAIRLGDPYTGIEALREARALYASAGYPVGEENVLAQLGYAQRAVGDLHGAISYLDSAIAVARRHGLKQEESDDLRLLAQVFGELGDHRRALENLRQARAQIEERGEAAQLGQIARAEAYEYMALGGLEPALERARAAAAVHSRSGAPFEELADRLLLAEIAERAGRREEVATALASAGILARRLDVPLARGLLALGRARVADLAGDARGTLQALAGIDADLERLGPGAEWEAHALRARAHARMTRWADAAEAGRLAVAAVDRVRGRIGAGPLRASYLEERAQVYADLVAALLRLNREHEALEVADAARSRALLEHISAARGGLRTAPARDMAEAERVLRRIDWLVEQLQRTDTIPERERGRGSRGRGQAEYAVVSALARELVEARQQYEGLLHRARIGDPSGSALLGVTAPVARTADGGADARAVQAVLLPSEAMLEYLVAPDRLVAFVVTREAVRTVEVPIAAEEIAMRVRFARDLLSSRGELSPSGRAVLRDLHALLMAPALQTGMLAGKTRLVFVPHSALVHLPVAALIGEDGHHLIEDFAVLTVPSAAALRAVRERAGENAAGTHYVFAPFPERLPGTRKEAAAVRAAVRGVANYMGSRATKPAVIAALGRGGTVHVATHGVLNELSPMFSRVELAAPRARTAENNGRLEVHELLGMKVRSDLVYLSGCETGAGLAWSNSFRRGQDYATLSQAFLYAGARNVMATLWRIDDDGAADFAARFYRVLAVRDPVVALAEAQRQMLRSGPYSAPRYWAAYTLSGSGELARGLRAGMVTAGEKSEAVSVPFRFAGMTRRPGTR